ncbi:MAG: phosphodiester glycosidase family protein [Phycisphaeraceae bacterium]
MGTTTSILSLTTLAITLLITAGCQQAPVVQPAPEPIPEPKTDSIRVSPYSAQTPDGPIRGYLAWIDLSDPALDVTVTAPLPEDHPGNPAAEASNLPTNTWAQNNNLILATNANFYGFLKEGGTDLIGLSVSEGTVVSPPRISDNGPDPAIAFTHDSKVIIANLGPAQLPFIEDAVAGVGGSETSSNQLGTLLVTNGQNTGHTARVQPTNRHPRTAAGVDASGSTLILAVIDGRREGWSVGVTLPELADIMIDAGAIDAVNLDGGGSSSFYFDRAAWLGTDEPPVTNLPSDAKGWRAVANHLGVRILPRNNTP